ncbi:NHLP bacteriocin system secretion protein [Methyloraptor flagellatus]|uniref:NHLP bacteriocin system secretion protein n=1 Tax=Methyloraptor flagellatus TaxID=3162530 RepID=A0AAU7X552_9HYPH
MSNPSIFREAALERLSTPERLDAGLTVVGSAGWALIWGFVILIGGGLIWSALLVVPVTVRGEGILLNPGGVLEVTSGSQGRVHKFHVEIGDQVRAGDVVAEIDQPMLRHELEGVRGELADALDLKTRTVDFQRRRIEARDVTTRERRKALVQSIALLTANNALVAERVEALNALMAKGITPRDKYLESRLESGRQQEELSRNQVSLTQLDDEDVKMRTEDERELLQVDQRVAAVKRKVAELEARLEGETQVKSPYDGRVAEIKVNAGEVVERGMALFTVLSGKPDDPAAEGAGAVPARSDGAEFGALVAVVYVPPSFGKQVKPGDAVEVAVSTARREEFGFVMGRVRRVAGIPSTAEGMQRVLKNRQLVQSLSNNAAPFQVVVDLYADPATPSGYRWSSSRGPDITLNGGTLVSADVEVRSVRLLALAVPQVRQLLDRFVLPAWAQSAVARWL